MGGRAVPFWDLVKPLTRSTSVGLSHERQRGDVIVCGSSPRKLLYRSQNGQAEFRRARRGSALQAVLRAFQSEFLSLALRFHKSAGDDQKNRTGRQGASRSATCGVRKKAERQPGSLERRDARPIAQESGRVAGVGDRKSTRLNSSHSSISYAVFCLKKKK